MGRPNRGSAPTSGGRAARTITGRWSISPDEAHEESDELDGPVGRKPPHQHDWRRPAPIRSWRSSPTLLAPAPAKHAQFDDPPPKIDAPRLTDTVVMRPLGRVRRSWAGEHSVACQRRGSPEPSLDSIRQSTTLSEHLTDRFSSQRLSVAERGLARGLFALRCQSFQLAPAIFRHAQPCSGLSSSS